jgi:hypothetical protein
LSAHFDVQPQGRGLRVTGEVDATVAQTCVVTLEPLLNDVHEVVDVVFDPDAPDAEGQMERGIVAVTDVDPPEPLSGGGIDLGAIALEFLLLGVDPYPRKPGAVFDSPSAEPKESAFAALAALKKSPGTKG